VAERILVVDDEPSVLRYLLRVLRSAGYEAIGAGLVREARAAAGPFAALVLDIGLPNGEPTDVQAAHPGVPTLTISGDHEKRPDLRKPFHSKDLVHAVQALIGGSA
jgi:DNA-binding response OmpR family regulator